MIHRIIEIERMKWELTKDYLGIFLLPFFLMGIVYLCLKIWAWDENDQ